MAQLVTPNQRILKMEARAIAIMFAAPYNAFSAHAACDLVRTPSITATSLGASSGKTETQDPRSVSTDG